MIQKNIEDLLIRLSSLSFDGRGRPHFVDQKDAKILNFLLNYIRKIPIEDIDLLENFNYNKEAKFYFGDVCPPIQSISFTNKEINNGNNPT